MDGSNFLNANIWFGKNFIYLFHEDLLTIYVSIGSDGGLVPEDSREINICSGLYLRLRLPWRFKRRRNGRWHQQKRVLFILRIQIF